MASISTLVVHVDGGEALQIRGTNLAAPVHCVFHFTSTTTTTRGKRGGPAVERVGATVHNASAAECATPKSPYRIVMHHQHRAPWAGCSWDERCMANSFSLSIESQQTVLNSFNMSYYYGSFSAPIEHDMGDSLSLQAHLYKLNHPADCSTAKVLLMKNPMHQAQCTGIGMVFYPHYITAMKQALEQGRALVLKDAFHSYCYFSDRVVGEGGEKYILPPSNCTLEMINASLAVEFKADKAWFDAVDVGGVVLGWSSRSRHTTAWYRSNFLKYLMRFTSSFEAHLAQVKAHISFHTPCIGVHLRRGERGNQGFTTVWLADYPLFNLDDAMRLLRVVKAQTNISTVVLATDEPKFFAHIPDYASEFQILHDTFYKRAEAGRDCVRETIAGCTPGVNASTVIKTILTEIHLLSQCSVYVGTLTSTFSKLAVDYMTSQRAKTIVVSLE